MGLLKKITKPISRVLDKIVPNELKPLLPYLSAFAPFMLPHTGIMSSMLGRGLTMGGINLASQLAQEGSEGDVDWLSAALAGGIGSLTAKGAPAIIRGGDPNLIGPRVAPEGFMGTGREYLARGAEFLGPEKAFSGAGDILGKGGTKAGFDMATLKAAALPITQGTADLARITAEQELKRLNDEEEETGIGINDEGRRRAIRAAMEAAGHLEETILDALASLGLRSGGIVGLKHGGQLVKRGAGRPGYAGRNWMGDYDPGNVTGWKEKGQVETYTPGGGGATTTSYVAPQGPSADDIRMIQETMKEVPTKVIGNEIRNLMQMGKIPNRYNYLDDDTDIQRFTLNDLGIGSLDTGTDTDIRLAEAINYNRLPGATKTFTPDWPLGATKTNLGVKTFNKEYPNPTRSEFVDVLQSGDLGGATTGAFSKNVDELFKGTDLDAGLFTTEFGDVNPEFMSPGTGFGGYIDIDKSQLSKDALKALPAGFFKARGGRVGALGGGIMHAKRGLVDAPGGYAGDKEEVDFGGITEAVTAVEKTPKKFLVDKLEVTVMPGQSEKMAIVNAMINDTDGVMPDDRKQEFYRLFLPQLRESGEISETEYNGLMGELFKANGGRVGYGLGDLVSKSATAYPGSSPVNTGGRGGMGSLIMNMIHNNPQLFSTLNRPQNTRVFNAPVLSESIDFIDENRNGIDDREEEIIEENAAGGGMMGVLPKGKEMDYRGGGVIPIGSRERADDVPARLSKNEFVMTADAVKAAGGGNINKGAKKMYSLMHNLEARV